MDEIWEFILLYKARIIGTILGLVIGWMIITYGWLAAIFWIICITIGYVVGYVMDTDRKWHEMVHDFMQNRVDKQ